MAELNNFGIWIPITLMAFFIVLTMGNSQIISGKIDLVFLAPGSPYVESMAFIKEAWRAQLLNHVEMGKKTKVSVVVYRPNGVPEVLVNMTNDRETVLAGLNQWSVNASIVNQYHDQALTTIRDKLLDFSRSDRAKVVIVFLRYPFETGGQAEAKSLREKGVFLFYNFDDSYSHLRGISLECSGSESRVFKSTYADMFSTNSFKNIPDIKAVMERDLCSFCGYNDAQRSACKPDTRQPGMKPDFFGDNNAKCSNSQPGDINCTETDCDKECDLQWPWKKEPNCTVSCGRIERNGSSTPKFENCQKVIDCSPCTTTSSTSSTTDTESKTLTGETEFMTTTVKPTSPSSYSETSEAEEDAHSGLLIAIGCLIGGLVLIVIVVVIIVVVKCRSNAAKKAELKPMQMKKTSHDAKKKDGENEKPKKKAANPYIELDNLSDHGSSGMESNKDIDGLKVSSPPKTEGKMVCIPKKHAAGKTSLTLKNAEQTLPGAKTGGKTSPLSISDGKKLPASKSGGKTSPVSMSKSASPQSALLKSEGKK